ncbi:hypothetical protein M0813_05297 [Anaeramoeba flamelloides]|uniref:Uncharacterized protein n=1 Tax=Anaeramoeba flamelloides TaxID=1746091 RepID=A0ABQ8XIK6_9EUKA|nr:hypothetical protein M0813_05297 [Anaeramoeba flamelloides]
MNEFQNPRRITLQSGLSQYSPRGNWAHPVVCSAAATLKQRRHFCHSPNNKIIKKKLKLKGRKGGERCRGGKARKKENHWCLYGRKDHYFNKHKTSLTIEGIVYVIDPEFNNGSEGHANCQLDNKNYSTVEGQKTT